jgi:hypothetical protein
MLRDPDARDRLLGDVLVGEVERERRRRREGELEEQDRLERRPAGLDELRGVERLQSSASSSVRRAE